MDWIVMMDENLFWGRQIIDYWKSELELEKWFDPALGIYKELIPTIKNKWA